MSGGEKVSKMFFIVFICPVFNTPTKGTFPFTFKFNIPGNDIQEKNTFLEVPHRLNSNVTNIFITSW